MFGLWEDELSSIVCLLLWVFVCLWNSAVFVVLAGWWLFVRVVVCLEAFFVLWFLWGAGMLLVGCNFGKGVVERPFVWSFSWLSGIFRMFVGVVGGVFEPFVAVSIWLIVVSSVFEAICA